jgi:hypothetical protein
MYRFMTQPETMLVIAVGAVALSIMGLMGCSREPVEESNTRTVRRTGSITPLGVFTRSSQA